MNVLLWWVAWLGGAVYGSWISAAFMSRVFRRLGVPPGHPHGRWRDELRPFALPCVALGALAQERLFGLRVEDVITGALVFAGWWYFRNDKDDDDRWKRRREKLAGKVAEVGGKLVVVPVGEAS